MMFEVEATEESVGSCDCCGNTSRKVWGFVHENGTTVAAYFLHWTVGKSLQSHPANFDLIYGPWGEGSQVKDRCAISLIHFENEAGPGVMVIDANNRPVAARDLVGSAMRRDEVLGTSLASRVFAIFDAVLTQDERLK